MRGSDQSALSEEVREAASELLERCHLVDVRTTRVFGEVSSDRPRAAASLEMSPTLEFFADTGQYSNRFHYEFEVKDQLGGNVATLEFTIVLDWTVPGDFTPDREAADFVASTTGYFAAFPYARELVHALSARLGIDPIVLGALHRDTLSPTAVTIALQPAFAETGPDVEEDAVSDPSAGS
jgi:hypothetical protein